MKIHYVTSDCGDGSNTVHWYRTTKLVKAHLADESQMEELYGNEGEYRSLTLPDGFDLSTLGVRFVEDDGE